MRMEHSCRSCFLVSGLALSVKACRLCQLPQSGSPWQFTQTASLCQGLSLWERWICVAKTERASPLSLREIRFSLLTPAICAIVTSFREKVSPSRWRNAKGGRDGKELLHRIIFYRKYGKNLLQIDNKRCIIYKWLWKPDTSSTDRLSLPVLRILCRRR